MKVRSQLQCALSIAALAAALQATPVLAQAATSPGPVSQPTDARQPVANPQSTSASATAAPGGSVDDIIVTAQKRSQSLQNVPIVVTTVTKQLLQDSGVKDIKD